MKIKKGDKVRVLTGKDKGREGEVMHVFPHTNKVIVDRVNVVKKHTKATKAMMQGGIIDKDMPVNASNVAIVCSSCGPTRISYELSDSSKKRVCGKCGGDL